MILMGDEVRRTQHGNNNAYCHDNEIELVRLGAARKHADSTASYAARRAAAPAATWSTSDGA